MLKRLAIALTILFTVMPISWGKSQKPTPPPPASAQPEQNAKPEERGTEQSPVVVKVLPTKESEEKAAADARHEDEKAENDRRLTRFTELLFWATAALSAIALLQLFVFGWQGIQLRASVIAAKKASDLANSEFISTHRPRLIVRHVGLVADHSQAYTGVLMGHDADANGGLSVVNIGGTNARIVRATYKIYFSKSGLPVRSPLFYENPNTLLEEGTLVKCGDSRVVEIWGKVDLGPLDSTGSRNIRQFETEGWAVYVMGQIRYQDDSGADHFMGFCRERQSNGRFRAVDDPDYEYED